MEGNYKSFSPNDLNDRIGRETGVSDWLEVRQSDVDKFAIVTRDHQFIHVNVSAASESPFGGTIAHGFFVLSLLTFFAADGAGLSVKGTAIGLNYGFDSVRFLTPVRVGARIRARSTLKSVQETNPGQYRICQSFVIEIDGCEKPALVADWIGLAIVAEGSAQ